MLSLTRKESMRYGNKPCQHMTQKGWPQAAALILSRGYDSKQIPQVSCRRTRKISCTGDDSEKNPL